MIEYAKLTATPFFNYTNNSDQFISKNESLFIKLYEDYADAVYKEQRLNQTNILKSKMIFESKQCGGCGGKLKFIKGYDFWGCENYKTPGNHSNFSGLEPNFYNPYATVPAHWVSEIIDKSGFKGKVTAAKLLAFYTGLGFEDLRQKYKGQDTSKGLNNFVKANKSSKEQEQKCLQYLKENFKAVVYQQCITYKMEGEKEKFCIPDFICSTNDSVVVVDAKLDYVNNEQIDLYISLLRFILSVKNDTRNVQGSFIMYKEDAEKYQRFLNSSYHIFTI